MGELIGNIWQKICSEEERVVADGEFAGAFSFFRFWWKNCLLDYMCDIM